MALLLYVFLIALGWLLKRNKWLYIIMSIYMYMLLAFRTAGADIGVYLSRFMYYKEFSSFTEILFTRYIYMFNRFGLSFDTFIQVSAILCLIVPVTYIYKESTYPCRVLSMYMLYSFPIDGVQIRNTLAFGIILIGLICQEKRKWNSTIIYIICVILATLVHATSIIYIIFLPINILERKKLSWKVCAFFIFELLTVLFFKEILIRNISGGGLNISYLISHSVNDSHRILVYITKSIIMFILEYGLLTLYERNCLINNVENREKVNFVSKLNWISLFVIPLYFFSVDLYRIQRYLFIFILVIIFGTRIRQMKNTNNRIMYWGASVLSYFIIYYMFFIHSSDYETTIIALLESNSILK